MPRLCGGSRQGVPLLCLHTAGADGRQYRHLLTDHEVTDRFRVIVFDMPWRQILAARGLARHDYQLTTAAYLEILLALAMAVVMGCSIGGRAVLHLARLHGARLGAVIGLNLGHGRALLRHQLAASRRQRRSVGGAGFRLDRGKRRAWETLWHYMQSGPGVFRGDLHFYKYEGDIRAQWRIGTGLSGFHADRGL